MCMNISSNLTLQGVACDTLGNLLQVCIYTYIYIHWNVGRDRFLPPFRSLLTFVLHSRKVVTNFLYGVALVSRID